jgi:hypothetical protein
MSYGNPDPYYQPEEFDATIVGEVEWSEPCWSFDTTVVWKDSEGFYRMASDSGCSCPTPFEDVRWDELERLSAHEVAAALTKLQEDAYDKDYSSGQVVELINKVMN